MSRDSQTQMVIDQLKKIYRQKLHPVEALYKFNEFHSPFMLDSEFDAVPQVLMIGQYSVGKTSFIEYLLGRKFPGQRVGPEPTTDRFMAVMYGPDERTIPGNAMAVQAGSPFSGLTRFGTAFLNKFEAAQLPCPVLQNMTLVDTPGILSGEKQRLQRGYDFQTIAQWFAERSDLILLLFDAHKLDISDEFKRTIEQLKGLDDKIRCVLNKADQVDEQKLMRIYGALMWAMGKIVDTPEVLRVYVGSFWDQPLTFEENASLFEAEENDLMTDFRCLPRNSAVRKINELVKRTRLAKVHAHIIGHLKQQMPTMMGKAKKQQQMIDDLGTEFRKVQTQFGLPPGDFPNLGEMQSKLGEYDFSKFSKLKPKMLEDMEAVLSSDIPQLMASLPTENSPLVPTTNTNGSGSSNQFPGQSDGWSIAAVKAGFDDVFEGLNPVDGKLAGQHCMGPLQNTGVKDDDLRKIWELADMDKDGFLDSDEFAVAMYLCQSVQKGEAVPSTLPPNLVPPSKR
jgi:EH domain-containing protein 1